MCKWRLFPDPITYAPIASYLCLKKQTHTHAYTNFSDKGNYKKQLCIVTPATAQHAPSWLKEVQHSKHGHFKTRIMQGILAWLMPVNKLFK